MRKLVKILGIVASLMLFVSIPAMVIHAEEPLKGSSDVVINSTNFPDDNFRSYISSEFDKDGDGIIHGSEIGNIMTISCNDRNIKNMKGIEQFTELTSIICYKNQLTSLDVSKNTELKKLDCQSNQLTSLNVSKNTALTYLHCESNQLTDLDVSKNTTLTYLYCGSNQLTGLDVSKNTVLTTLSCYNNQLTSLDVSKNEVLKGLYCHNNQLKELDIQNNTYLKKAYSHLKREYATTVYYQYVDYDDEYDEVYYSLECDSNVPIGTDVLINSDNFPDDNFRSYISSEFDKDGDGIIHSSELLNIQEIRCSYCNIKKMSGIEKFTALTNLYCYGNQLDSLYVYKNKLLKNLYCGKNQLTSLDVSKNTALEDLRCYSNQLYGLDVSNNLALKNLSCYDNQLKRLDVSKNTELASLVCTENELTSLDIQNNIYLKDAYKNGKRTVKDTTVKYKLNQDILLTCDKKVYIVAEIEPLKITLSCVANGVLISWKEVEVIGASKYRVYKKNAKGNWAKLATVTAKEYTDTTVKIGETATYSVIGLSDTGKELNIIGNGTKISFKAPITTPTAKYRQTGTALSWGKVSGATKYRVFRKVGSGDWKKLTTTTSLSYVDKTVVYGKTYTYAVRAMKANGSYISDMGSGTSFTYLARAPYMNLSNEATGVNIKWTTITGAVKYRIFVKNSSGAWEKLATIKDGTTYTDKTTKSGENYTYAVVGMDSAGRLMNAYGTGSTIKRKEPFMSFDLMSAAEGVLVFWEKEIGAGKYRVYRKNADGSWATLATVKDGKLSYKDTTAEDGKTYTYSVVAMSSGGTALTVMGEGKSIEYVKPVSEAEVEVTDLDGNIIVYTISGDEITEDYITIVPEDQEEIEETEEDSGESSEDANEEVSKDTEEISEDKEDISEDTEEISEDAETISEDTDEKISEDSEDVISEDNKEESNEEVTEEETENNSEELSEDAGEENAEETVNSEIEEEIQE